MTIPFHLKRIFEEVIFLLKYHQTPQEMEHSKKRKMKKKREKTYRKREKRKKKKSSKNLFK
jgi:hypothetical protein